MLNPALPWIDLHRHLDGNIRTQTIWELAQEHGVALPVTSAEALIPLTQIQDKTSDLLAFLAKLDYGVSVLANTDACYRVAYENMQDAFNEKLDYVELRFSPYYMGQAFSIAPGEVTEAVIQGCRDGAKEFGVDFNLIGILSRTFGIDACRNELDGLLAHRADIVALDLAGDELGFPAPMFVDLFKQGRDAGWAITVHAGEADGPQSIWNAINLLGAQRIGHGVAARDDDALIEYLANHEIGVESCPTSNYQTATVVDTAHHPMKMFLQRGIPVTINTDDPGVSALDLAHEYQVAKDVVGLDDASLLQAQKNSLSQAFLSDSSKQTLSARAQARANER